MDSNFERHLIAARYRQQAAVRLWQNGHTLQARYHFWLAGHLCTATWEESGDFFALEARTTPGTHPKWRATRLARRYFLRALSAAPSAALYTKVAAQHTALRVLDCRPAARIKHAQRAAAFETMARRMRYREVGWGRDSSVPPASCALQPRCAAPHGG
ncbi:MAG: hypothetical protein EOO59_19565, partial [Hymenobacter sp.]